MINYNLQRTYFHNICFQYLTKRENLSSRLVWKYAKYSIIYGSVLVILMGWLADYGYISLNVAKYTRGILLLFFLIYFIHTGTNPNKYNFRFGSVLFYFLLINIIYSFFSSDIIDNLYYTSRIAFWILGTIVFYRLFLFNKIQISEIYLTVLLTIAIGTFFTIIYVTFQLDDNESTNASAYLLVWCLPLWLIFKKTNWGSFLVGLVAIAVFFTVKRGAIIAFSLSTLVYIAIDLIIIFNPKNLIKSLILIFVIASLSVFIITSKLDFFVKRFEDTSGSGRDQMYTMLFDRYINAELFNIVFGFGIGSVQDYTGYMWGSEIGVYAHSDLFQYMSDFGLLGIVFLIWLHFSIIRLITICYKNKLWFTPSLTMCYTILFLINIYSGQLMSPVAIYFGITISFASVYVDGRSIRYNTTNWRK